MIWKPRKAARVRTLAELHDDLAVIPGERSALERAIAGAEAALPDLLANDPAQAAEAMTEVARFKATLEAIPVRESALLERIAALEVEAAEKAKTAERATIEKEADGPMATLVRKIEADAAKLAADIERLEEHRARAQAMGVADAEYRVRSKPGRLRPAITERVTAWFSPDGKRYGSNLTYDDSGRVIKATDRVQREVVDVIHPEVQESPTLVGRLVDALPALKKAIGQ
jgi:hypothetical protein